jgi:hypothetical protein
MLFLPKMENALIFAATIFQMDTKERNLFEPFYDIKGEQGNLSGLKENFDEQHHNGQGNSGAVSGTQGRGF